MHNAAALTDAPRLARKSFDTLSPEQARRLLDVARGDRLEAVYTVALALGMRMGEILGVRWTDIDLDGATLCVKQAISRIKGMGLAAAEPEDRSFAPHVVPSG